MLAKYELNQAYIGVLWTTVETAQHLNKGLLTFCGIDAKSTKINDLISIVIIEIIQSME